MGSLAASLDAGLGPSALARVVELGADLVGAPLATERLELTARVGAVGGVGRGRFGRLGDGHRGAARNQNDQKKPHGVMLARVSRPSTVYAAVSYLPGPHAPSSVISLVMKLLFLVATRHS